MRKDQIGDGMPTGLGAVTQETRKKSKPKSFLQLASEA